MTIGLPEPCRGIFTDELPIVTALGGPLRTGSLIPERLSGPANY